MLLCYLVVHVINVWCIWSSEHLSYFRMILKRSFFRFRRWLFVGQLCLLPVLLTPLQWWWWWWWGVPAVSGSPMEDNMACGGVGGGRFENRGTFLWFPMVRSHGCISAAATGQLCHNQGREPGFRAPMLLLPHILPGGWTPTPPALH